MGLFTSLTVAMGITLSAISGIVCYCGEAGMDASLGCLPRSDLLISHPQMALACGAFMVVLGVFCQPSRT
jgi:hypothetical protein